MAENLKFPVRKFPNFRSWDNYLPASNWERVYGISKLAWLNRANVSLANYIARKICLSRK